MTIESKRISSVIGSAFVLVLLVGDGVPDTSDNCPSVYNTDQRDADADGVGDSG